MGRVFNKTADLLLLTATSWCKPSIILFDALPGTRNFTVPKGVTKIRAFVVGGGGNGGNGGGCGGGYSEKEFVTIPGEVISYTVGGTGGTSSFKATISATGGNSYPSTSGGVGSGGTINTNGGAGPGSNSGSGAGNRFGNGIPGNETMGGCWFGGPWVDGWGLGTQVSNLPYNGDAMSTSNITNTPSNGGPGSAGGGSIGSGSVAVSGGHGGIGGGGGGYSGSGRLPLGGPGCVGVEVLEVS